MANVTITKPEAANGAWDVDCDGVKFSVDFRPTERDDPRLKEFPTDAWTARITRPDGTNESRYGNTRELAFTKAAGEMRSTQKLVGVEWGAVMRALAKDGAFR